MSYDIQLYRKEVREKHLASPNPDFFEAEGSLPAFTETQKEELKSRLLQYRYFIESESAESISFRFSDYHSIEVLLTNACLYFSASGDGIFEISMTSSEFTDSGEFAKYDPQADGWEEF